MSRAVAIQLTRNDLEAIENGETIDVFEGNCDIEITLDPEDEL